MQRSLEKSLQSFGAAVAEREARQAALPAQLPLWHELERGTPNSFLRSALFAAILSKDRRYMQDQTLASSKDVVVKFTGMQLNQEDLGIWETLVHLARNHPLGDVCQFTAHGILKAMGMKTGGTQHDQLHKSILRLTACVVSITHERKTYFGSLVEKGVKDEVTKHYTVKLNTDLIRLYGETQWTALNWKHRQELRSKHLALALHGYYSSHGQPYPVKLETLHQYTGSQNGNLRGFKQKTAKALDELVKVGFLRAYEIEGNTVKVARN